MGGRIGFAAILLVACVGSSGAEIYRWIDERGEVHFSDRPVHPAAEEVTVFDNESVSVPVREGTPQPDPPARRESGKKLISAEDYQISAALQQKGDYVYLSGRVSGGPPCKVLLLDVFGHNSAGVSVHIIDRADNLGGFMSDLLEGKKRLKTPVSADRWEITSIRARCLAEN